MSRSYYGKCALCADENVPRMPVMVDGKLKLVCNHHGASTAAIYDAIEGDARARVYKVRNGFTVAYLRRAPVGAWMSRSKGRRAFAKRESAEAAARKYLGL